MKHLRIIGISASSLMLVAALVLNTVFAYSGTNGEFQSNQTVFSVRNMSSGDSIVSHGVTLKEDGTFDFSVNGKTYKNEYERLLGEDGFIFGIDYNRFANYSESTSGLGYDQITSTKSYYKPEYVERSLYNLRALGYNAINAWITMGGSGYIYDDNGIVIGLNDSFIDDLNHLLESCRRTGIDLVPTLLVHGWGGRFNENYNGLTPSDMKLKYSRYYYDETAREAYINNGINPICEILSHYQDVIPIVNLTVENTWQTNDLENGMLYGETYTWKDLATTQNALHDASKRYMPDIPTSVEDLSWNITGFKYNDLKVDIIGHNFYSVSGSPSIQNRFQQRPAYLGEMNVGESENVNQYSDEVLNNQRISLFRKAKTAGYIGGFYFCVHSMAPGRNSNLFAEYRTDDYSLIQNYALSMTYEINDLINEHRGITTSVDKPVMLYNFDSATSYWIGGRGVDHFILERSDNGGDWHVIDDNINSMDHAMENGLIQYEDTTRVTGVKYRYRVTSVTSEGLTSISEPSNVTEVYLPEEMFVDANGNYAGGFEDGAFVGKTGLENSSGWYTQDNCGIFTTEAARSGKYSFYIDFEKGYGDVGQYTTFMRYRLKLKPDTNYKFGVWVKNKRGNISTTIRNMNNANLCYVGLENADEGDDDWHYYEVSFTSPSDGLVQVVLMNASEKVTDTRLYIDDMTITEFR